MKINIPEGAVKILNRINEQGYEAYIVGGCVRDALLGREPNDWDITTSALPNEIKSIFRRTVDTGIKHGTVTVLEGNDAYEVTTYRIDGEYEDGRHPKEVTFTRSLEEDLKRRDFTINAMAYHPESGIVDLFEGQKDLERKVIRCVGSPVERFSEDALRMMRAIRFAAQLSYSIEEDTFEAIKELSANLSKISVERINVEMTKLLISDNPYYFKKFYEAGLTKYFMPEFDLAMETNQNHKHHMYSVGEHILHSIENIAPVKEYRLAMLLHDIAKPKMLTIGEDGITHFYGHPFESAKMSKQILRRLKYDNATIDMVYGFVLYHDYKIEQSEKAMRKAINKIGEKYFPALFDINKADILAQSNYMREEKLENILVLRHIYSDVINSKQPVSIKDLALTGKDLIELGVKPGKGMGDILNQMLSDVIEEPSHNSKEYLIKKYVML